MRRWRWLQQSRQTQSQWLLKVAERLKPLRALMHAALLAQEVVFADETPLNVLSQEGNQSYMWLYGTGRDVRNTEDTTPHLVLHDYQDSRSAPSRTRRWARPSATARSSGQS